MISEDIRSKLAIWADSKPTVAVVYAFGSRAKGTNRPDSDLDLAFEFVSEVDCALSELIENANRWKSELTALLGVRVKDLRLRNDKSVENPMVIWRR